MSTTDDDNTIWDMIVADTVDLNKGVLDPSSPSFEAKFERRFLTNVQNWILKIFNFMENDEVKSTIEYGKT